MRLLPARLENRGFNVALLEYRVAGVVATVEADDNHVVFTRGFQRRFRPQRHGIVAGNHTDDIRIRLQNGFHTGKGLRLAPVRRLLGDHFHFRIVVQHIVITLRADAGVSV